MLKDRGTIKWNALMLPEHVKLLRDWKNNDEFSPAPDLSEWELEHIERMISHAFWQKCSVQIFTHEGSDRHCYEGVITKLDTNHRSLVLNGEQRISFSHIYCVEAEACD
ncbi:YolD-like family protein [Solibacillus sp. CAU 1738]|uniref:YolD-like family protein n=1 Tax=Solibacillus sp. CAU 1738 TaxID=3140363 RepID=UPI0032608B20